MQKQGFGHKKISDKNKKKRIFFMDKLAQKMNG